MSVSTIQSDDPIITVYAAYCQQRDSIMNRHLQILALVPGSSVASFAITLLSDPTKAPALENLILPLGLMGTMFLIGLFIVVRIGLRESKILDRRIQDIEAMWEIPVRPFHEDSLFNHEMVISIIFSVSLAGWICVALWFVLPGIAIYISGALILLLLIVSSILLHTEELPGGDKVSQPVGNVPIARRQG